MTATLRERAEHAAKYGSNLMVPARDIKQLLDELTSTEAVLTYTQETARLATETAERTEARTQAVRELHTRKDCPEGDYCEHCPCTCGDPWPCATRRALDGGPQ